MNNYIVLDIGGTFIKYGVYNSSLKALYEDSVPTPKDTEGFVDSIVESIKLCKDKYNDVAGIAISMAGFIDPETGENTDFSVSPKFRLNYKEMLSSMFNMNVSVENDANCAAIAEMKIGAGKGSSEVCMITVGTGIGGAIVHNGELFRGKNFKAGEFGITYVGRIRVNGEYVYNRPTATAELVRRVKSRAGLTVNGKTVYQHVLNPVVKEIYEDWVDDIAMLAGNLAFCFDPEKILLGGGISKDDRFMSDLIEHTDKIFPELKDYTKIERCTSGNDAGKIGALVVHLQLFPEK